MTSEVTVREVEPLMLAAGRGECEIKDIPKTMMLLLAPVWPYVKGTGIATTGINIAVYRPIGGPGSTRVAMAAGAQVTQRFPETAEVHLSSTPAGRSATATFLGPYDQLSEPHDKVQAWCKQNGQSLAGPS